MSKGKLHSYFGPMYAGKSTALINHVEKHKTGIFAAYKPKIDNRYSANYIETHDGKRLACSSIEDIKEISFLSVNSILIDEIQFFDGNIVKGDIVGLIKSALENNINIIVGGLDKSWQGDFFPISQKIITMSDVFVYLNAKCFCCGENAEFSYKKVADNTVVSIGGNEMYEARCIKCWNNRNVA